MKVWILTKITADGKAYTSGQEVGFSMVKLTSGEYLSRISGTPAQMNIIRSDGAITELTDDEALEKISEEYPNSALENVDVPDPEIDDIAKSCGLDPKIRADIVIPTRGNHVLQDQENYLMTHICEKIGLTEEYWDTEAAKTTKWDKGIDIKNDFKDGNREAHEFVLSRIRTHA